MKRIAAHYLYTMTSFEPIMDGFVDYDEDGTIVRIGRMGRKTDGCGDFEKDGREVDCKDIEMRYIDGIVMPGMVNSHCHIELSYLWKKFRRGTGMAGFIDQINAMRDNKSYDEKLGDIRKWMDRLWKSGVSAMGDVSNCADSFGVKKESPMYTRTFLEVFGSEPEDCGKVMNGVGKLWKNAREMGLDAAPTPHACYTMSPQLVTEASEAGLTSGFLSYHSEETPEEEEMMKNGSGAMYENRKRSGMSMPPVTGESTLMYFIDRLHQIHGGEFDEHILLVHEVCMDKEGMGAVKKYLKNAYIALCPLSNIFIHNMLPPVMSMREEGMRLTIGTDSLSSNDDLNMVSEMFCIQENFGEIPLGEILSWASINGAKFLKKDHVLGSIEPGKSPGLVVIDHLDLHGKLTSASKSYRII